ncbi:hypothetical protein CPT75_10730 [Butyrivibrio fibrisolvens]|uniref:Uncharacterized protein n=1 Tax=Butyrivibrio fibrisolvens TaxID=831 RepID=A0A317G0E3_BUTFI|nr:MULTISPECIES: hypothetical protein [Lachnospiraceae]PWT27534.1 hypothetical protein CPT75_10730 [Butyrivibrio fibrisolvens]
MKAAADQDFGMYLMCQMCIPDGMLEDSRTYGRSGNGMNRQFSTDLKTYMEKRMKADLSEIGWWSWHIVLRMIITGM